MNKTTCFLFVFMAFLGQLMSEIVVLRNGTEYSGKVVKADKMVTVRKGRKLYRFPSQMVYGIYKNLKELKEAKKKDVFFLMKKPLPSISVALEEKIKSFENEIFLLKTKEEREKKYKTADKEVKPHLTSLKILEQWLSPVVHPKAIQQVITLHTPWLKNNPRAISLFKIPKNYDPKKKSYPLVISLHGTDDTPVAMSSHMHHVTKSGCFHLAPRTTGPRYWQDPIEIENIYNLIAYVSMNYRIDPRRIVLCGGSAGGMGTWSIVANHPMMFARAGSFSGMPGIRVEAVKKLKHVPMYILHGTKDHIPVSGPRKMVKELKRLKYEHVYVEHPGDHFPKEKDIRDFREWLQKATPKENLSPRPAINEFVERVTKLIEDK